MWYLSRLFQSCCNLKPLRLVNLYKWSFFSWCLQLENLSKLEAKCFSYFAAIAAIGENHFQFSIHWKVCDTKASVPSQERVFWLEEALELRAEKESIHLSFRLVFCLFEKLLASWSEVIKEIFKKHYFELRHQQQEKRVKKSQFIKSTVNKSISFNLRSNLSYQINLANSLPKQHFSLIYNNRVNKTPSKVFEPNNHSTNHTIRSWLGYIIQKVLNKTSIHFKLLFSLHFYTVVFL